VEGSRAARVGGQAGEGSGVADRSDEGRRAGRVNRQTMATGRSREKADVIDPEIGRAGKALWNVLPEADLVRPRTQTIQDRSDVDVLCGRSPGGRVEWRCDREHSGQNIVASVEDRGSKDTRGPTITRLNGVCEGERRRGHRARDRDRLAKVEEARISI